MKKRKGFISAFILIVMSISIVILLYLYETIYLDSKILASTKNNVQAFYNAEGKILLCLNEKYLQEQLIENTLYMIKETDNNQESPSTSIRFDSSDLEKGDMESDIEASLIDSENRKNVVLTSTANINGTRAKVVGIAKAVNNLFEMETPILDSENLTCEYMEKLEKLRLKIEGEITLKLDESDKIYGFENENYEKIILNDDKLICSRDSMVDPYIESVGKNSIYIIGKKYNEEHIEFNIEKRVSKDRKPLAGIIYVEGNVNISTNFNFNGIMIVNGGDLRVDSESKLVINGMLIYLNEKPLNMDNIEINYDRDIIYRYGIYLPGFIDINIDLIKSS